MKSKGILLSLAIVAVVLAMSIFNRFNSFETIETVSGEVVEAGLATIRRRFGMSKTEQVYADLKLANGETVRVWWPNDQIPEQGQRYSVRINERSFSGERMYQVGERE